MNLRKICPLAAALGLLGGSHLEAKAEPPVAAATAANQKLAEAVAARLTSSTLADGSDVSIMTDNGAVTIRGTCLTAEQKKAILSEIRVVPGVRLVRDGITIGQGPIRQAQAAPTDLPMSGGVGPMVQPAPSGVPPMGMPGIGGGPGMGMPGMGMPIAEPAPMGMPGMGGMAGSFAPQLPPYAWPTYAPHNNASRIAYPQAYPYNAFPFIGPFYPFPKVPLGWRSVNLTWEDGHWWYGRTAAPKDYWRVRFW